MVSWADAIPEKQGLYLPEFEKDSCGVGFITQIKGVPSHSIVYKGQSILCNMTHRGAEGADARDGDGAGVMTAVPHSFFQKLLPQLVPDRYAVGNIFMNQDPTIFRDSQAKFVEIAHQLGLSIIHWRSVPVNPEILGPVALAKQPKIVQPFVTWAGSNQAAASESEFDEIGFQKQLYILCKRATHRISSQKGFYICSLNSKTIVYKGLLAPVQVYSYFPDLQNKEYISHFCLVHSRYSTNTFPSWDRAQPMRWSAHNGEINTLRGNKNWMTAREGVMKSAKFRNLLGSLYPIIEPGGSDSAAFDNVLELLVVNGVVTLPEAVMMMIPEAWQNQHDMDPSKKAFYEWSSCLMEAWDGPALFTFSDGRYIGASLDRNGLRPCRVYILEGDIMVCASEVGTLNISPETVVSKGRLQPGKMLLVDTLEGRVVDDEELKMTVSRRRPYSRWVEDYRITLQAVKESVILSGRYRHRTVDELPLLSDIRMLTFGFNLEHLNMIVKPMMDTGKEPLGSMGNDTALACLSMSPRMIYDYFKQLFAQVTNPPIDPIREEVVMSLACYTGPMGNILELHPSQCRRLRLYSPILSVDELQFLRNIDVYDSEWRVAEIDITFAKSQGVNGYVSALDAICLNVEEAIHEGYKIAILTDFNVSALKVPISALAALGAVHHHLVKLKLRSRIALVVETGEAREVHQFCVLLGYGADAVCPYLALDAMLKLKREGLLRGDLPLEKIQSNYITAANNGIKKVMSKMGISTLQSYKGAQIFEALGLDAPVIDKCFAGTASRIRGIGFDILAYDALTLHALAFPSRSVGIPKALPDPGDFHWRKGGENHINHPSSVSSLQDAVRRKNQTAYDKYSDQIYQEIRTSTLRGLLDFKFEEATPVPLNQVEPWTSIVKRFVTGAMSYGSISLESHAALAVAMNKLGGKSNTGEGGEDPERSIKEADGSSKRSAIKQVASGRFGVTSYYLSDADELQIKMAQGAKPGEGGELPGYKVSEGIAKTRKSTPGVGLISPPPHHDIYSIEDLKQLIYDLKCSNPNARVSVKLVSEVGVGIIASGVAKARADHILISGHDGGTGASRWTGIKHAGLPWELGLAETHQTLVLNNLRGRVVLQTDGGIKTGRDVAIACLLGAEEWGFATTPLIAMGCIMMRKCHLNTCPVGIATQDPILRKKFEGSPENVINFFYFVAEELRNYMARLGFRSIDEMVGRADLLVVNDALRNPKTRNLDLAPLLTPAFSLRPGAPTHNIMKQDHLLNLRLDNKLIQYSQPALTSKQPVTIKHSVVNTDRTIGATLSFEVSKRFGEYGLPPNTIHILLSGSAGQSLGAFLASGITIELEGDSNDYVGKGLSGGTIIVYPSKQSRFKAENNIIVGNVCLYGATSGNAFFSGIAAERFCVRNSGALAVVEGVGDHGCEYMTGGRTIILGSTGRNFAAGMSGGIAYILDEKRDFKSKCNMEMVDLDRMTDPKEIEWLRSVIQDHRNYTGSGIAKRVLEDYSEKIKFFVKVFPKDYKAVLLSQIKRVQEQKRSESSPVTVNEPKIADIEDGGMNKSVDLKNLDKMKGFMKYQRQTDKYRNPLKRIKDWKEVNARLNTNELKVQAARCMDCGVPFCQSDTGCPIGNVIPLWNELVFSNQWKQALERLLLTNNFPEFTGRVCPAPCEGSCVLGINELPVSIKSIECAIIDRGFEEGWMQPKPPSVRTGKHIAIIGSGPAGLAAADQLNKAGHYCTVYERNDRFGGLLVYGIPNMKLDKKIVQRRIDLMEAEGIKFINNAHVGKNVDAKTVRSRNDIILLAIGSTWPRDLPIPNRNLDGIHFAMEFLQQNTKSLLNSNLSDGNYLNAKGKNVIVIGGGDTGTDCIGTSIRHGAKSVINFELLPKPPSKRAADNPWPQFPRIFRVDYGHAEAEALYNKDPREYCVLSKEFVSNGDGAVKGINTVSVEWVKNEEGNWKMVQIENSEKFYPADLVLLAMGFLGPEKELISQLAVSTDQKSNIETTKGKYATSVPGIFAAGDCHRGQSLIVWGIDEGRQAAREIDLYLTGSTRLPITGGIERRPVEFLASRSAAGLVGVGIQTDYANEVPLQNEENS